MYTIHAAVNVLQATFSRYLLDSSTLHSSERWSLAMSSSDEIVRLLNLGAADSHALMEVITEYFAESNVGPETDEEDVSVEGKQYYCTRVCSRRVNVKKNYMYYNKERNKSKNINNTFLTRQVVICTINKIIFRC